MNRVKRALRFALCLLPVGLIGGYFIALYQLDMLDEALIAQAVEQLGNINMLLIVSALQATIYAVVCGFFGYIIADKLGIMKPVKFERSILVRMLPVTLVLGFLFSLDYWTFGKWIPALYADGALEATLTPACWISSILYGGIIEETMLRLFLMSLIGWLIVKLSRGNIAVTPALIAANFIAAAAFAAGHLPATVAFFGALTPLLVFRCFLLNGAFALYFGRLFRKHGIQYAMLAHLLLHVISKLIWTLFV